MHLAVLQIENDSKVMNYSKSLAFEAMSKLKLLVQNCLNEPRFLQFVPEKSVCFSLCVDKTGVCEDVYHDSLFYKDTQINNTDTFKRPVSVHIERNLTI